MVKWSKSEVFNAYKEIWVIKLKDKCDKNDKITIIWGVLRLQRNMSHKVERRIRRKSGSHEKMSEVWIWQYTKIGHVKVHKWVYDDSVIGDLPLHIFNISDCKCAQEMWRITDLNLLLYSCVSQLLQYLHLLDDLLVIWAS